MKCYACWGCGETGKATAIRCIAVRETSVSGHPWGPIEGSIETNRTSQHNRDEGFKGILNLTAIM